MLRPEVFAEILERVGHEAGTYAASLQSHMPRAWTQQAPESVLWTIADELRDCAPELMTRQGRFRWEAFSDQQRDVLEARWRERYDTGRESFLELLRLARS